MVMATSALPFGIRQVKLTPLLANGSKDSANAVFLPAARTFSFSETEDFSELQGDDRTVASHGAGPVVEWDLEGGGISFAAWKIMAGGAVAETGVSPAGIKTYTKKTSDSRPYFEAEGRAISDNGGDFVTRVYRCKADGDLEGEMANGEFLLTTASGKGYGDETTEKLYEFIHNETVTPLTAP